jgi:hypothetical protein
VGAEFLADRRTDRNTEANGLFITILPPRLRVTAHCFISFVRFALNFEADCYESEIHVRLDGDVSVELVKLRRY